MNINPSDEQWTAFSVAIIDSVETVLGRNGLAVRRRIDGDHLVVEIFDPYSLNQILSASTDGVSVDVTLVEVWQWRWQDAVDGFPELDKEVGDVLANIALSYSAGRAREIRTLLGRKLHVPIGGARFVNFASGGYRGFVASSNVG